MRDPWHNVEQFLTSPQRHHFHHHITTMALTQTTLGGALPLVARGKVRDIYSLSDDSLLFVATDRISAYDVVMKNVSFFNLTKFTGSKYFR